MQKQSGVLKRQQTMPGRRPELGFPVPFGNYTLIARVDSGGMGEVYLAEQRTASNRQVAIKIIRADLAQDMTARRRFEREAKVHAYLKHTSILPLYESGLEQGRLFLVTPYIEGGTLARRLRSGPLALGEIHEIFSALVKAVAYIHRHGVVHRDLKPANILLDSEEVTGEVYVRLIDFGIACIPGESASPPLTAADVEMGTLAYMAPERMYHVAQPSNDIYSLGVILHQMLTGRLPEPEQSADLPKPFEQVVNRCLAPDPDDRLTANELRVAFESACQALLSAQTTPSALLAGVISSETQRDSQPAAGPGAAKAGLVAPRARPTSERAFQQPLANRFTSDDHADPTIALHGNAAPRKGMLSGKLSASAPTDVGQLPHLRRAPKPRRRSLLMYATLLLVLVLLLTTGILFFTFQSVVVVSANVSFTSQVRSITQVFLLKGALNQQGSATAPGTIPVKTVTASKSEAQSGPTSQRQCFLWVFACHNVVTASDVDTLSSRLKQDLDRQLSQQLQQQLQTLSATQVGSIITIGSSYNANPDVGATGDTVTVTQTEQLQAAYIINRDAQQMARNLLAQKVRAMGANYRLQADSIKVGEPVIEGAENNNTISIAIAAGGVVLYQFPPAQLRHIQLAIEQMKVSGAIALINSQPGVDTNTTSIRLSFGNTLPGDAQRITITVGQPTSTPTVYLPVVQPSPTP